MRPAGTGRCRRCGRPLRNPLSRLRGIGPSCWEKEQER